MEGKRQLQHNFSAVTGGGRVKKYDFNQAIPRAEKHKPQKRRLGQRNPGYFQEPPQRTALRGRHRAEPKRAVRRRRAALSGRYLLKNFTSFTQADGAPTPSLPSPGRLGGAGEPSPGSEPASQPASPGISAGAVPKPAATSPARRGATRQVSPVPPPPPHKTTTAPTAPGRTHPLPPPAPGRPHLLTARVATSSPARSAAGGGQLCGAGAAGEPGRAAGRRRPLPREERVIPLLPFSLLPSLTRSAPQRGGARRRAAAGGAKMEEARRPPIPPPPPPPGLRSAPAEEPAPSDALCRAAAGRAALTATRDGTGRDAGRGTGEQGGGSAGPVVGSRRARSDPGGCRRPPPGPRVSARPAPSPREGSRRPLSRRWLPGRSARPGSRREGGRPRPRGGARTRGKLFLRLLRERETEFSTCLVRCDAAILQKEPVIF